ncbi:MAG: acyl-CoA reductase [Bacteroidetes bacterium]|nr:acyl-CoA reductase [Bacteroidota bacterium]
MTLSDRISAFAALGSEMNRILSDFLDGSNHSLFSIEFNELLEKIPSENPWFTRDNINFAWKEVAEKLDRQTLQDWIFPYAERISGLKKPQRIAVVMSGNIPMAGFHDFLCTLITGHKLIAKCSSADNILIPFLSRILASFNTAFSEMITFTEGTLAGFDKVIASGSNNTSRYFEYYFRNHPHIIRKHRNGIAILDGKESADELKNLGEDIFRYFGLGCRSISKMYIPNRFRWEELFESMLPYQFLFHHHKYRNNYDYQKAIRIMNNRPFLDNGFVMFQESAAIASPIGVLFYETYDGLAQVMSICEQREDEIQCIVSHAFPRAVAFGEAQKPSLQTYADKVDTIRFLTEP